MSWSFHRVEKFTMSSMSLCLKKALSQHVRPIEALPPMDEEGQLVLIPEEVLEVREKRL
jgi:hypothetical protein